jgi:hypothetical protein
MEDKRDGMTDEHIKFTEDMEEAGFEVRDYNGRFFYKGPAVATDRSNGPSLQDVMGATRVPLQWDNLGLDYIIYPK